MLRLLALEIPSSFLWNQQIVFISAFNHFFPPNSNVLSFPSPDSSVYMSAPHLSSLSLLFLFPYYEKEEEKIREGDEERGWKCKYRSVALSCDRSGLITPTSPLQLAHNDLPSISLACLSPLHYEVFHL